MATTITLKNSTVFGDKRVLFYTYTNTDATAATITLPQDPICAIGQSYTAYGLAIASSSGTVTVTPNSSDRGGYIMLVLASS